MLIIAYGFFILIAIGVAATVAWGRAVRQYRRTLLHTLALIVAQRLPLIDGLRCAAELERRRLRQILESLARQLELGLPLHAAMRVADRRFPTPMLDAIDAAERGGTLPAILRSLARDLDRDAPDADSLPFLAPYVAVSLIAFVAIVLPLSLTLLPMLDTIAADYGVRSLPSSADTSQFVRFLRNYPIVIAFAATCVILMLMQIGFMRDRLIAMNRRGSAIMAAIDEVAWATPGIRTLAEAEAMTRQLPMLIASIESGNDLPQAARYAAMVDANSLAQRRLQDWAREIEAGVDALSSARRLGFSRPALIAIEAGLRDGSLGKSLDYLLSYYRCAEAHWSQMLSAILVPLVTITFGIVTARVLWTVYGTMIALSDSIQSTM
ncbi:MAG: type II secretion system F family protein [Phycisphaerae bacterium]